MLNLFEDKQPLTPNSLTQRPYSVRNNEQNSNKVSQPLESNSFKINKRKDFFSPSNDIKNKTFYNARRNSENHPLDFYTKGKIASKTIYNNFEWNKGIRSTSNDIITRNALSINTKKFNELNLTKKLSPLCEQNITENNYMEPIKTYKTYEKYNLPKYATNIEMYRLMKEKYFSKDIHSPITQGKCLSPKEFIKQKELIMNKNNLNIDNIKTNDNNDHKIKNKEIKYNNKNEFNIKKKQIKEINKSMSQNRLIYKDPNDYSIQILKSNTFYFDKNNNQMLQAKKWIRDNKK